MNMTKLLTVLVHFPAPLGGYVLGYAQANSAKLDPTTMVVMVTAGIALMLAGGMKLAGLLPDDSTADVPAQSDMTPGEGHPGGDQPMMLSLDMAARHPGVDESIRQHPEVRRAMAAYLDAHPSCEVCGGMDHCQVHHKMSLWAFVGASMAEQIQHASDPANFITLCEDPAKGNHHLWWGHDGSFAERCVPNIAAVITSRKIQRRTA